MIKMQKLNHWAKKQRLYLRLLSVLLAAVIGLSTMYSLFFTKLDVEAADTAKSSAGSSATDYTAEIGNKPANIYWTNATYFDYLTDTELSKGWLNADQSGTGFSGSSDDWYPFKELNKVISNYAGSHSSWTDPLYFGNYCNVSGSYDRSTHNGVTDLSGVTTANIFNDKITAQVKRFNYAANNSNGLGNTNDDRHRSYQGLVENELSDGKLMAKGSTTSPYFDATLLGSKARTVSSYFPFTTTKSTNGGTTYYKFDSNGAQDNVYFSWKSTGNSAPGDVVEPEKVYYGSGTSNGVQDGLKYFMSPDDTNPDTGNKYKDETYYGIFPFNNRKAHGDTKTTATNTRYLYASKGDYKDSDGWKDCKLHCYFYNDSGDVGAAWPGYEMEEYFNCDDGSGGKNVRIKIPDGATKFIINNGETDDSKKKQAADSNDLSYGAFYLKNDSGTAKPERWGSKPDDAGMVDPGNEAVDYGFGIRMDMKFRVPDGGYDDDNKPVEFTYSGDDDLWVYITDSRTGKSQLVLDLGGNHKKAEGNISFVPKTTPNGTKATCQSTAKKVYGQGDNEVKSDFEFDYSHTYTMTIFYMERGMFESNCMMAFSMTLPENNVIVDKTVDTSGVNNGISTTDTFKSVVSRESFDFTAYQDNAAAKNYEYTFTDSVSGISTKNTDDTTGVFPLRNKQSADFTNKFTTGHDIYVDEDYGTANKFSYDTSWNVYDLSSGNNLLGSSSTLPDDDKIAFAKKTKPYNLKDSATGATIYDYAELQYSFANKIQTGPLSITKKVKDYLGNEITASSELKDDTFNVTVYLDIDGNGYQTYNLDYTDTDGNAGSSSSVTLKHNRTVTINKIPVGTKYKIVETVPGKYSNPTNTIEGTIGDTSGSSETFTNQENPPGSTTATLEAKKSFVDDQGNAVNFTIGSFEFVLKEGSTEIQRVRVPSDGNVSFDAITYNAVGNHTYTITETADNSNNHITYDSTSYTVTVAVTKVGSNLVATKTYNNTGSASTPPTFVNTVKTGSVTVNKSNQAGGKLEKITFAVYKVSQETVNANSSYDTVKTSGTKVNDGKTDANGNITFTGLAVYENNQYNSTDVKYQNYALIEQATDDAGNYRLNKTVHYFKFDNANSLSHTFGYVNGHLKSPTTAGEGTWSYVATGLIFIALSAVSYVIYLFIKRPRRKKLAHLRA